jgi:tensin
MGCAPYLQIFKAGKLICTSAATLHVQQSDEELPFVQVIDGTVPFNIGQIIQGDILIRCRHLTFKKRRVSMFRAAFHTGYVPPNVLRLSKSALDGACSDKRYPDDFFLDLIFEKVDAETITKHLKDESADNTDHLDEMNKKDAKGKGPVVKASSFDSMLKGDSRFWDVINSKKEEHIKKGGTDPFWGPTVGRRRGDSSKKAPKEDNEGKGPPPKERSQLETFSIGNEFDFLPVDAKEETMPTRDSLMDALNALDEDDGANNDSQTEEIIFDSSSANTPPVISNDPVSNGDKINVVDVLGGESNNETKLAQKSKDAITAEKTKDEVVQGGSSPDVDDMDALLAATDEDFGDLDLADFDDDDDLNDLENMLKT